MPSEVAVAVEKLVLLLARRAENPSGSAPLSTESLLIGAEDLKFPGQSFLG